MPCFQPTVRTKPHSQAPPTFSLAPVRLRERLAVDLDMGNLQGVVTGFVDLLIAGWVGMPVKQTCLPGATPSVETHGMAPRDSCMGYAPCNPWRP
jgi:hypothetical protein